MAQAETEEKRVKERRHILNPLEQGIAEFLENGEDWARMRTSVPGIFLQKVPAWKRKPNRLAVEINPVDEAGNPTKKAGTRLFSLDEYEVHEKLMSYEGLPKLLAAITKVNPVPGSTVPEGTLQI